MSSLDTAGEPIHTGGLPRKQTLLPTVRCLRHGSYFLTALRLNGRAVE
jgi:hypothetical protein